MAINKNFVVKNGFEVNTNLIVADATTDKVGIGTTVPKYGFHVMGGIGVTDSYVSGVSTISNELRVGTSGSVFTVIAGPPGVGQSVGVGTAYPEYLLDVRSPVSTGQTALYVYGDLKVTGDLNIDDVVLDQIDVNRLFVSQAAQLNSGANLYVTGISTFDSYTDINNYVDILSGLNVTGVSTFVGVTTSTTALFANHFRVAGVSTFTGITSSTSALNANHLRVAGVSTFGGITTFSKSVFGADLSLTGIATVGTVRIGPGIITASSGIVTYYGDGSYLTGVGIITAVGSLSFANGSAISPSWYFNNSSTTGVFSPTAGQQTFVSAGSSILNINPNGIRVTGVATATDFDSLSDINYKENINTVNNALLKVEQMRGVKFNWKESGNPSYGVIAQELQEVLPELVHGNDPKTVNYNGIIGVLIEAIKELKAEVEELKNTK